MKKKVLAAALAAATITQAGAVNLIIDNVPLNPDVPPTVVDGRTLVPVRAIFEALGAEVEWDGATNTARAVKGAKTVTVQIGSTTAYVDGTAKTLDVPAQTIDDRTMVPARFVSEAFGADVKWDGTTETVTITTDGIPESQGYYFKDNTLVAEDVKIEIVNYAVIPVGKDGNLHGKKPVIAFWYNTTNLTGKSMTPISAWFAMFTAIQDNNPNAINELDVGLLPDVSFSDSQSEKIKKGGTVLNAIAYELDDDTTPITLKATRGLLGEDLGEQTFEIKKDESKQPKNNGDLVFSDGVYIAGKDFPVGTYTVKAIDGYGLVYTSNMFSGGMNEVMTATNHEFYFKQISKDQYEKCKMPEGTQLHIKDLTVKLMAE
ncbi:MAG: stalk domain-containing protein [Candidatus Saccharibacteria bacterium]|nr:stalk domain-containing protein [Candidatus Saccharibacteria bacterium]